MKNLIVVLAFAVLTLTGCSKKNGDQTNPPGTSVGNGFYLNMYADLTDAKDLTTTVPDDKNKPNEGRKRLKKLTAAGEFKDVLTGDHGVWFWKQTPTHIIAQVDIREDNTNCYLIAIPKVRTKSKVLCLSREELRKGDAERVTWKTSNNLDFKRPQFDVRGSEVYFTQSICEVKESGYCKYGSNHKIEIRKWDGVSEMINKIYETDYELARSPDFRQVFLSQTNKNMCYQFEQWNQGYKISGLESKVFCLDYGKGEWKKMELTTSQRSLKIGNKITTGSDIIDLETLHISRTKAYTDLPEYVDFEKEDGSLIVGRSGGEIIVVRADGNGEAVAKVDRSDSRLVVYRNDAWFYGSDSLQKLSLSNGQLDPTDYKAKTGLAIINDIAWSTGPGGDFLRVEGNFYDKLQGITVRAQRLMRPDGTLSSGKVYDYKMNYPIELKWDPKDL